MTAFDPILSADHGINSNRPAWGTTAPARTTVTRTALPPTTLTLSPLALTPLARPAPPRTPPARTPSARSRPTPSRRPSLGSLAAEHPDHPPSPRPAPGVVPYVTLGQ
ncbi:hypothetical protein ACWCPT_09200 [Streptomyces sp. NPDC002308]